MEKELYKSKNTKYSQIISTKDADERLSTEKSEKTINYHDADLTMRLHRSQIRDKLSKSQPKAKRENLFPPKKAFGSKKLLSRWVMQQIGSSIVDLNDTSVLYSRISEELDAAPIEQFHTNLDFGERLFVEKFIALEISIWISM